MNRHLNETQADSASVESAVFAGREAVARAVGAGADAGAAAPRAAASDAGFAGVDEPDEDEVLAAGASAEASAAELPAARAAAGSAEVADLPDAADSSEGEGREEPAAPDLLHFDMASVAAYKRRPEDAPRPEPRVVVLPDFCLNLRGGSCSRCVRACPAGAISLEGKGGLPVVDEAACTMCGICLGICDVFASNSVTMADLVSRMRRAAGRGEGLFVTCPVNVAAAGEGFECAPCVVEVPCLASLSPEFWTLVLVECPDVKIACDLALCSECERAGSVAEMLYTHAVETAQAWSGKAVDIVDEVPAKTGYLQSFVAGGEVDRRGAFSRFAGNVADAASGEYRKRNSGVLQEFYERQERMRAMTRQMAAPPAELNRFDATGRTRRALPPKRKMLLDAIERDPAIAARVPVVLSETDCSLCCNALDCARACPTGARSPHAENGLLAFDVRLCTGCGLCAQACKEQAAFLMEDTAEVFRAASDEPALACPEKLAELEAARAARDEAARNRGSNISEAT